MTGGTVVILGPTGRNFGAGMSGGIAYVWDPDDVFHRNLNNEMVDLDPLSEEDVDWLRLQVRQHVTETNSAVGQRILDRWHSNVRHFKKVMPKDFKRVLEAQARAEAEGLDVDEAIMASAQA